MAFTLVHRDGARTQSPPLGDVLRLLAEVADGRGSVAVQHEAGWTLTVHGDGVVAFGNVLDPRVPDRWLADLPPRALVELSEAIAVGSFYETLDHEWQVGTPPGA
jgi:hypothetical protein